MHTIIAPSFFQKKNCVLPGIGSLQLVTHPAATDFNNTQIIAPYQEIIFKPINNGSIFNEFSAISELILKSLDEEGKVLLDGIGIFTKDHSGDIQFSPAMIDADLLQPVFAERVIHKDAQHKIIVGDKETTNVQMTEFFNEEVIATDKWWIWALVLGIAGVLAIAYYCSQFGFNMFANSQSF